jgi:rubrerythrin
MGGMGGGGGFGGMLGGGGGGINYVCISCGHKFKGGACPRCGSKMRRADF